MNAAGGSRPYPFEATKEQWAEGILVNEPADLVAIGRQALYDPFWATHAAEELAEYAQFETLPKQYGWWLDRRKKAGFPGAVNPSQADVAL